MSRFALPLALAPFLLAGCSGADPVDPGEVSVPVARNALSFPEVIPLPLGFSPEGVVVGAGTDLYVGSLADGAIVKGDLRTGAVEPLVAGQAGALAVGLAYDPRGHHLFVAGGFGPTVRVYDAGTGALVGSFDAPGAGFLNDVIVTREAAFVTDSFTPTLYRLPLGPEGSLPDAPEMDPIPLGGDFVFIPGAFNANGIETTADGSSLLVVNGEAAELYEVDPRSGGARKIDVDPAALASADGLVFEGPTLFVVQNFLNRIAVIHLDPDLESGVVEEFITSPLFRIPTTADRFGDALYAVNARFDVAPPGVPNDLEFEVVRVAR